MSCKLFCFFIFEKCLKTFYLLLLIVLMTLWIVLCVEATRQIAEVSHLKQKGKLDDQHRRVVPLAAGMGGTAFTASTIAIANRFASPRLHALTIFNTVLEELIGLMTIVSLFLNIRRLASLSLLLLLLIWFIEQYRISDLYHQIDYIDAGNARIIIATHVIHFIVCLLGIILSCINSIAKCRNRKLQHQTEAANLESVVSTTKVFNEAIANFEDIENRVNKGETIKAEKKKPCAWIRSSTIVKKMNNQTNVKNKNKKSLSAVIGSSVSSSSSTREGERPFLGKKKHRASTETETVMLGGGNQGDIIETPIETINKDQQHQFKF